MVRRYTKRNIVLICIIALAVLVVCLAVALVDQAAGEHAPFRVGLEILLLAFGEVDLLNDGDVVERADHCCLRKTKTSIPS